jgi:hypothetical protein
MPSNVKKRGAAKALDGVRLKVKYKPIKRRYCNET